MEVRDARCATWLLTWLLTHGSVRPEQQLTTQGVITLPKTKPAEAPPNSLLRSQIAVRSQSQRSQSAVNDSLAVETFGIAESNGFGKTRARLTAF